MQVLRAIHGGIRFNLSARGTEAVSICRVLQPKRLTSAAVSASENEKLWPFGQPCDCRKLNWLTRSIPSAMTRNCGIAGESEQGAYRNGRRQGLLLAGWNLERTAELNVVGIVANGTPVGVVDPSPSGFWACAPKAIATIPSNIAQRLIFVIFVSFEMSTSGEVLCRQPASPNAHCTAADVGPG